MSRIDAYLERQLKVTEWHIGKELGKETPCSLFLANLKLTRGGLIREIEDAKKMDTPKYRFLAAMQEHSETIGPFCGFY